MMQTALLEVKNLSFSRADRVIFLNAAFSLAPKESLGLCGPIGCGKTTLLRILTGLERPQAMTLSLEGVPVTAQRDFQRLRRKVGYVLQNPDDQLFFPEVIEDVMFGPLNLGLSYAQARSRALDVLSMLGIANLAESISFRLSGGQKRRVAIAGVMAMHPRVLVLDEPAAGLDPEGRDTILSQIRDYHEKTGITVLLVSHSMEVLVMSHAKLAMYDTVEKVFGHAQELLELGLSVPQVTQIFLKLRQMGLDIPTDVYTMPYAVKTIQKALAARQAKGVQ